MNYLTTKYLIFWDKLSQEEREFILNNSLVKKYRANTTLYHGNEQCPGLIIMKSGQARVFIHSNVNNEITLYRLIEGDVCIMGASCLINSLNFEVQMQFEKDSEVYIIPKHIYKDLSDKNNFVKDFNIELISSRLSDVICILNDVTFLGMKKRLANILIYHSQLEESTLLKITHEDLAKDLGTAREVITRLLKQLKDENILDSSRGSIKILDLKKLGDI